jgi:Protein of unknown function (DUF3306)
MSDDRDDEAFLSRWSRQKRSRPQPAGPEAPATNKELPFDASTLPNIDDLTEGSDFAAFMQKGVPEALQRLALRRMWSLEPSIRDFVEVAENQWDFNAPGGVYGLFQEIEPGTDMSVWLAQATSSIAPPEKTTEIGSREHDTVAEHAAVSRSQRPVSPPDTVEDTTGGNLPGIAHTQGSVSPSPDLSPTADREKRDQPDQKKRRRHGGAVPV